MSTILPKLSDIQALSPLFATAAQEIYNVWEQDEDGMDVELGSGGICDLIADAIVARIHENLGGEVRAFTKLLSDVQHVNVAVAVQEGVWEIDIPYAIYERGGGFNWTKIPGVTFSPDDLSYFQLSRDPAELYFYIEDAEPDPDLLEAATAMAAQAAPAPGMRA